LATLGKRLPCDVILYLTAGCEVEAKVGWQTCKQLLLHAVGSYQRLLRGKRGEEREEKGAKWRGSKKKVKKNLNEESSIGLHQEIIDCLISKRCCHGILCLKCYAYSRPDAFEWTRNLFL
jgi:hypothetical protein